MNVDPSKVGINLSFRIRSTFSNSNNLYTETSSLIQFLKAGCPNECNNPEDDGFSEFTLV